MGNEMPSSTKHRDRRGWIYKCTQKPKPGGEPYSWIDPGNGYLAATHRTVEDFGGKNWIRSSHSWFRLEQTRRGDLIFCHQTDLKGLVGVTVAASDGYSDPTDIHPQHFTCLALGPQRVRFGNVVSISRIRESVGVLAAYSPGTQVATFHSIEPPLLEKLIRLCKKENPSIQNKIDVVVGASIRVRKEEQSALEMSFISEKPHDPVRHEITVETFERKAAWAKRARSVYGDRCMVPGCSFKLIKVNEERYIEVHHLRPMCEGGSPNDIRNMSVLCPNHHRMIHYGQDNERQALDRKIRREQDKKLALIIRT